jgi:hypothetical protein
VHSDYFEVTEGKTENAERRVYLPKRLMSSLHKRCAGLAVGQCGHGSAGIRSFHSEDFGPPVGVLIDLPQPLRLID